jgi:alpha-amylase/alpha-mannosidase (GH57 family)
MIYWTPFLHFYQPPTQYTSVLDRICDECYRPLIRVFESAPNARATCNVTGALTELLREHAKDDILDGLRCLGERGKVEFTGSGMYHPILPLIPSHEQRRQIRLNLAINRRIFGPAFRPAGFFPPEMAVSTSILPTISGSGYRWVIASGVANSGDWPLDFVPRVDAVDGDLAIFFRDDLLSNQIAFREIHAPTFFAKLRELRGQRSDIYVITAMDAETFGHHHRGWEELFLAEAFRLASEQVARTSADRIQVATVTDLLETFPAGPRMAVKASSWSTGGDDLSAGNAFPLWNDPSNEIHHLQWEVARITSDLVQRAECAADNDESRHLAHNARIQLDRALHSCQFWWASRRPMWEVNMINRGLCEQQEALLNATRSIRSSGAPEPERRDALYHFIAARDLAERIVETLVE